ncbi:acetyltransferase [Caryophanon tenue]|uniref:Acetyltransferase n=2 Tax=Caryophanon tenue TaxID=33978 RepID=A0A1C0YHE5_9BACL|nr:acetyltransferase [Caryophanon tenue]
MMIQIIQATPADASSIAPLIVDAIGDIANRLTGEEQPDKVLATLEELITKTNNRHSYAHTFVAKDGAQIVGIAVLYDGATGRTLDRQLEQYLAAHGKDIIIDVEAHDDEFYIDTVCVHEAGRGKGIGTLLLQFAEQEAQRRGFTKISLNVEEQKIRARQLYERIGYTVTEPWHIINEPFHHMVKNV